MNNVIAMEVNTTRKAFRINGVTFAKSRLGEIFPGHDIDDEATFCRYLTVVPFLNQKFGEEDYTSPTAKYAIVKAKRIWQALGIDQDEGTVAFMLIMMSKASNGTVDDIDSANDLVRDIANELRKTIPGSGKDDCTCPRCVARREAEKPTLH